LPLNNAAPSKPNFVCDCSVAVSSGSFEAAELLEQTNHLMRRSNKITNT